MDSHAVIALASFGLVASLGASLVPFSPDGGRDVNNTPPVVSTGGNLGNDYLVDCNNTFTGTSSVTHVQLDGSGSYDPDGTPVTFYWHNECQFGSFDDPTSPAPVYTVDMNDVCARDCWIVLRVTSGGQMSHVGFQVFVEDMSFPVVTSPNNYLGIWGDSTDVSNTGLPVVTDNCDPKPTVGMLDTVIPATGPGQPELNLSRLWTATDCMGLTSTSLQSIQLLAPTGNVGKSANMDFDPNVCPNAFSLTDPGTVDIVLVGMDAFSADRVIPNSLRVWVREAPGVSLKPGFVYLTDCSTHSASFYGDCNAATPDGKLDVCLRVNRAAFVSQFQLDRFVGQRIEVLVTGNMRTSMKLFATRDFVDLH